MKTFLAALVIVALAGCGSSNDKSSSSSSSSGGANGGGSAAKTTKAASSSAPSGPVAIPIQGFAFTPSSQTVKVGQKVTWTNKDSTAHNVTGGPLHSPTLDQGKSYSFTPTKPGTISYVCTFHANMKATLTVVS